MITAHPYLRGVAPGEPFNLAAYSVTVAFMSERRLREQRAASLQRAMACQARQSSGAILPVPRNAHLPKRARVLAAIGDQPLHIRQIVRATGLSITQVRNLVYVLVRSGKVERVSAGTYRRTYLHAK